MATVKDGEVEQSKLDNAFPLMKLFFKNSIAHHQRYSKYGRFNRGTFYEFSRQYAADKEADGFLVTEAITVGLNLCGACSVVDGTLACVEEYINAATIIFKMLGDDGVDYQQHFFCKHAEMMIGSYRTMMLALHKCKLMTLNAKSQDRANEIVAANASKWQMARKHPLPALGRGFGAKLRMALAEAMADLDALIGLAGVKGEVKKLMSFLKVQQARRKHGLRESGQTLHFVFTGNPGTGKTSVARILSKMLFGFEILKTTRVVECSRSDLVGGFLGQTAITTDESYGCARRGAFHRRGVLAVRRRVRP